MPVGSRSVEEVWSDHLKDEAGLKQYSIAMKSLATGQWAEQGSGRIVWCVDVCEEYFVGGALAKLIHKDLRRLVHSMSTLVSHELLPRSDADVAKTVETFQHKKWTLLDVGSCYNPFSKFDKFDVTAIDIAPANSTVLSCDFLNVTISDSDAKLKPPKTTTNSLTHIKAGSFDVVVFSLLLSYLPTTELRLTCCINAHKSLSLHGLLLIITPDSSHQNRHAPMMKSWKQCIETLGFHRWKYVKDTHLHCMAFRKTQVDVDYDKYLDLHGLLHIPQDSHNELVPDHRTLAPDTTQNQPDNDPIETQLNELPFCDST